MDTKEIWAGKFGDDYLKRNRVEWQKRIPFWMHIMDLTGARSVFEFGANAGWNLSAIQRVDGLIKSIGHEINRAASDQAVAAGLNVSDMRIFHARSRTLIPGHEEGAIVTGSMDLPSDDIRRELAFTAGVLIHIPPEELKKTMQSIIDRSYDYVLAIEYEAEEEIEIEYQGQSGLLWKRPYGKLYEDMGLTLIETGKLQEDVGFDNCTYNLLRK